MNTVSQIERFGRAGEGRMSPTKNLRRVQNDGEILFQRGDALKESVAPSERIATWNNVTDPYSSD